MTATRHISGRAYVPALQAQHDLMAARAERDAARLALATARRDALEEAAKLMATITGEGKVHTMPGYCARGWKIKSEDCEKCGATDNQNCPGDLFDAEKIASAIRALTEAK